MKLLVTGFNGFVAGSVMAQAPKHWEMHGIGRSDVPASTGNIKFYQVDLLNKYQLADILYSIMPDAVVHAAAIANIDFCETNREMAEAINVESTRCLAGICREIGAKLIFCSTDAVFDGKRKYYTEEDLPAPVNYYADTKLRAEQIVLAAGNTNVVARLALVIGLPVMGKGNSFLADILEKLKTGASMKFPLNEIRTPVDVLTLGAALNELAAGEFGGIIHLAGNTRIDRYEMARQIALISGFPDDNILAINSGVMPGRAPRSADASLSNARARTILKTRMLDLTEGLSLVLSGKNDYGGQW